MVAKRSSKSTDLLEVKYAKGCTFYWPYADESIDYKWYCLLRYGWLHKDLESFFSLNDPLTILGYPSSDSEDLFSEDDDLSDDNPAEIQEKERLLHLADKLRTWSYAEVICSFTFFLVGEERKRYGKIMCWEDLFKTLESCVIGPELFSLIQRNGWFALNPKNAIKDALIYFSSAVTEGNYFLFFDIKNPRSSILRILASLDIDSEIALELTNKSLETKDFFAIVTFLENYHFYETEQTSD